MKERESIPFAPALIESMRSIGYSFETAIADLLDNSISARAKNIDIQLYSENEPVLTILDDGYGMNKEDLESAMRYGSTNPLESRDQNDLGRFGLGMKSASLSQCRRLSVVSKRNNYISCFVWDLDHIIRTGRWSLLELEEDDIFRIKPLELLSDYESGTLLILEKFDRVMKTTVDLSKTLNDLLVQTIDHLSLIYHRYIEDGVIIKVNNEIISAKDPFLTKHKSTLFLRSQTFTIDNESIVVKPYILPHINKLSFDDISLVGGKEKLRSDQGFYIYRNRRLIIWGTWFNLERKHELNKLARVRVDIPNSLDYVWSIDVKKSSAKLPDKIKHNLHNAVYETVQTSEKVHTYRGRKENTDDGLQYIWHRIKTRSGYSYKINRDLPELRILSQQLDESEYKTLNRLLNVVEETVPASSLYLDVAKGIYENESEYEIGEVFGDIVDKTKTASDLGMNPITFLEAYLCTEPYKDYPELTKLIREEMLKYE